MCGLLGCRSKSTDEAGEYGGGSHSRQEQLDSPCNSNLRQPGSTSALRSHAIQHSFHWNTTIPKPTGSMQDPEDINEEHGGLSAPDSEHMLAGLTNEKDLICMTSGQVIKGRKQPSSASSTTRCTRCRHQMLSAELKRAHPSSTLALCPLCHFRLPNSAVSKSGL